MRCFGALRSYSFRVFRVGRKRSFKRLRKGDAQRAASGAGERQAQRRRLPVTCKRVLGVIRSTPALYFFGILMTCAEAPGEVAADEAFRKKVGDTFQCCPFSVMTVTDFRLYLVMMPVSSG